MSDDQFLNLRIGDEPGAAERDELLKAAFEIARGLRRRAVPCRDGSLVWSWLPEKPVSGVPTILGPHLYRGTTGIALFLAACERVCRNGEHHDTCLRAIQPLRRKLQRLLDRQYERSDSALGIGGLLGLGSFLYAFVRIGELLGEPELLAESNRMLGLFTPERIESDDRLDVMLGSAGALLALLALERATPAADADSPPALQIAAACAQHLLDTRVSHEGRPRAWRTVPGRPPLGGFAHGTAGICHALLRLYGRTRRPELLEAAHEGLVFERTLYAPEYGNWRDLGGPEVAFMTNWCHGAPGICLGHLGNLAFIDTPEVREEIHRGLETTRSLPVSRADHLCCGNLGRADILLVAYRVLGELRYLEHARNLALNLVSSAPASGRTVSLDPTLFVGLAGIGLTLLRLALPEAPLPCVLLLE
jgi:type 2 lantibiotic biosynthesis protein LanM